MVNLLKKEQLSSLLERSWEIINDKVLEKDFSFSSFKEALNFINQVGALAESVSHHPDIFLHDYKKVKIFLTTHSVGGLSEKDFIVAEKIEQLCR